MSLVTDTKVQLTELKTKFAPRIEGAVHFLEAKDLKPAERSEMEIVYGRLTEIDQGLDNALRALDALVTLGEPEYKLPELTPGTLAALKQNLDTQNTLFGVFEPDLEPVSGRADTTIEDLP